MNEILTAIILGIVQGITEWLPISSSGHLVLFQNLLGFSESSVFFDIMLHLGSLVVIFIVFRQDIIALAKGIIRREKKYLSLGLYIIIGTIPIFLVGFFLNSLIKSIFDNLLTVGISLLATAVLLYLSRFRIKKKAKLDAKNAIIIGISQAAAILPGISRSGSTISTGLILGLDKEEVARFSFMLVIPAILGAALLEISDISSVPNLAPIIVGTIVSVITGFMSLKLLLYIIRKQKLSYFSWYCAAIGLIAIYLALL